MLSKNLLTLSTVIFSYEQDLRMYLKMKMRYQQIMGAYQRMLVSNSKNYSGINTTLRLSTRI